MNAGGSATAAGQALFCHPNTVRYRLRRVEELTGRSVDVPRAAAELTVALQALRVFPALVPTAPDGIHLMGVVGPGYARLGAGSGQRVSTLLTGAWSPSSDRAPAGREQVGPLMG